MLATGVSCRSSLSCIGKGLGTRLMQKKLVRSCKVLPLLLQVENQIPCKKSLHSCTESCKSKPYGRFLERSCMVFQNPKQEFYTDTCKIKFSMQESCKLTRREESCKLDACLARNNYTFASLARNTLASLARNTRLLLPPCKIPSTNLAQYISAMHRM